MGICSLNTKLLVPDPLRLVAHHSSLSVFRTALDVFVPIDRDRGTIHLPRHIDWGHRRNLPRGEDQSVIVRCPWLLVCMRGEFDILT